MIRVIIALLVATYGLDVRAMSEKRYRPVAEVLPDLTICNVTVLMLLEECIAEAIESMSTYLVEGVEELDIPSLEPYFVAKPYERNFTQDGYKGYAKVRSIKITGMSRYVVTNLKLLDDSVWSKPHVSFVVHFPNINIRGVGYLNGTLGSPVHVEDIIQLSLDHLEVRINGTVVAATEYEYFFLPNVSLYFIAHGIKFSVGNERHSPLTSFQKYYLRRHTASVWSQTVHHLQLHAANFITTIANNIFSNFRMEDLLPNYYSLY